MASGLMFDFLASSMYEVDRSRMPGQIATMSSDLLADILNKEDIPVIITHEMVEDAEARWQHLKFEYQASDVESLYAIIEKWLYIFR